RVPTHSTLLPTHLPPPPRPTLFPYTTLFRSRCLDALSGLFAQAGRVDSQSIRRPRKPASHRVSQAHERNRPRQIPRHSHRRRGIDRKSTRLNSSHVSISYAVFCLKKKNTAYT